MNTNEQISNSFDNTEELDVENNLPQNVPDEVVDSDAKMVHNSDAKNLSEHNEHYTALLKSYVDNFNKTSKAKEKYKKDIFQIAKILLVSIPIGTLIIVVGSLVIIALGMATSLELLPELLTALGTLAGTFLVIPQMITGYLFNEKEEDHLAEIIGKIQDYDRNIRDAL